VFIIISESHARHLLHHLAEVGRVRRDEGRLGPLQSARLPLRDLLSSRQDGASLAFGRRVWVGAARETRKGGGGGCRVRLDEFEEMRDCIISSKRVFFPQTCAGIKADGVGGIFGRKNALNV
jgi:hypothetical protein